MNGGCLVHQVAEDAGMKELAGNNCTCIQGGTVLKMQMNNAMLIIFP